MSARRKGSGKAFEEQFATWALQARAEAERQFPDATDVQVTHYANEVIVTVWLPQETSAHLFKFIPDPDADEPVDLTPPEPESEAEDEIIVEAGVPVEA